MTAEEAPELQREVQRLLGRCMLRLQQCEAVIKAVVVHYEFSGPASNLAAILEAKSDAMKKVSLGTAVGKLVGTYLVPEGQELPSDDGARMTSCGLASGRSSPWMRPSSRRPSSG